MLDLGYSFEHISYDVRIAFSNIQPNNIKLVSFESPQQGDSKTVIIISISREMHK
jgi:hypothetical protein